GEGTTVIVGFRYGLDPTLSGATNWTTGPAGMPGAYASLVTALTPNTTYFFDAWATGHGFTTGGIMSFRTMVLPIPSGTPSAIARVEGTLGTNGWYISNVTVTLIASDSLPFVAWIHYLVDDGPFQTVGFATNVTLLLADGLHIFAVRATDLAGNAETQTQSVTVDTNLFGVFGPFAGLPIFLLLNALAIAVTVLVLRRRRKGKGTSKDARSPPMPIDPK